MSTRRRRTHGDPRKLGGRIAGPGGPRERNAVVIDTTDAVLLDGLTVSLMEGYTNGEPQGLMFAAQMSGRINKTVDRAEVLYLMDEDGVAAIVTEILSCASRSGPEVFARVMAEVDRRMTDLHAADAVRPVEPEEGQR